MFKVEEVLHDSGWLQVSVIKNLHILAKHAEGKIQYKLFYGWKHAFLLQRISKLNVEPDGTGVSCTTADKLFQ